jgi:regulator of sirC expression with transglutaminase-like and TPR domain
VAEPRIARERFAQLVEGRSDTLPLDSCCAWLAAEERPELDPQGVVEALDRLSSGVRAGTTAVESVARLNLLLFTTEGFSGDEEDYQHPRNSLIDQVLSRRLGIPILLCVIYMEVARRIGVTIEPIGFPGHFLIAPEASDPRFYVDPFNGGRILKTEALLDRLEKMGAQRRADPYLRTVSDRYILIRICNNLKGAFLRRQDVEGGLRATERLLLLSEDLVEERRDRGLMLAHLGRPAEAVQDLERYLDLRPNAPDRARVEARIGELS